MARKFLLILLLIVAAVLGFWVVMDNPDAVTFKLMGFTVSTLPLGVWALLLFLVGCCVGILVSLVPARKPKQGGP